MHAYIFILFYLGHIINYIDQEQWISSDIKYYLLRQMQYISENIEMSLFIVEYNLSLYV